MLADVNGVIVAHEMIPNQLVFLGAHRSGDRHSWAMHENTVYARRCSVTDTIAFHPNRADEYGTGAVPNLFGLCSVVNQGA